MLSFDVTDRKIRIIKGTESNGKIKISSAAEIELEEAVIVNGHVNDINRVAVLINQVLKRNNMPDKEAIVAISSNQTVFKELLITPNPKESEFMKEIRTQLQVQINVDDSYSVAYVIVGDPEEDDAGEKKQRVLVTACPYDVIDCYKRIFHMLGINLKTVMIGCNAITKVLLADSKVKAKMPLLAVQVDGAFISLNLYENNQLSFSRFASIDPEDYNDPDDYVYEAVVENVFRMLQFARSRGTENIENVVFYGDINASPNLYNRLIDELSNNELTVSQINVPPQIHGYQNLEFSLYANAIGAMFKRNKLTEHINLLETEGSGGAPGRVRKEQSIMIPAILGIGVALLCVGGAWAVLSIMDGAMKSETKKLQKKIDDPETAAQLQLYDDLQVMKDKVLAYKTDITHASEAYKTFPILEPACYEALDEAFEVIANENTENTIQAPQIGTVIYSNGLFTIPVTVYTDEEFSQKYPAELVKYLLNDKSDMFAVAYYGSYTAEKETVSITPDAPPTEQYTVHFDLAVGINNEKQLPEIEAETEPETEPASENAEAAE